MPRGRGAGMPGRGGGELREWDRERPPAWDQRPPGPRPRPPAGRRGPAEGRGLPPGGPLGVFGPGPSPFLPLEPWWGTDQSGRYVHRLGGDQKLDFCPAGEPGRLGSWRLRLTEAAWATCHNSPQPQYWWDSGLGTQALLDGWRNGGRVTIEQSMSAS